MHSHVLFTALKELYMHVPKLVKFDEMTIHDKLFEVGVITPHELKELCDLSGYM